MTSLPQRGSLGTRLYFSSQRGDGGGMTYEVSGPFHGPA
jgi:hypothetical protein